MLPDLRLAGADALKSVLAQTVSAVYILAANGTILYLSEGFIRLCGYERDDVLGRPFLDLWRRRIDLAWPSHFLDTLNGQLDRRPK